MFNRRCNHCAEKCKLWLLISCLWGCASFWDIADLIEWSPHPFVFQHTVILFGLKPTYTQMTLYILGIQVPSNSYLARQILINMPAWVRNHPQLERTVGLYGGRIVFLSSRRFFLCVSIFILPILECCRMSTLLSCHKQMTQFLVSQRAGGASSTKDARKVEKE